jgi:tetratricopeptide (TPR) repeat protein
VRATALVEATAYLTEAAELRPADAAARLELSDVLAQLGRREAATAEFERALGLLAPRTPGPGPRRIGARRCGTAARCAIPDGHAAAPSRASTRSTPSAVAGAESRAELLLIRAWSEVTIEGSVLRSGRSRSSNRWGWTSSTCRCGATTCAPSRASR